jgi:hypothetical protein
VACYDNAGSPAYIGFNSLVLTNSNTATVTFASAQTGSCKVIGGTAGGGGSGLTSLIAGTGLTGGTITTSGSTIGLDTSYLNLYYPQLAVASTYTAKQTFNFINVVANTLPGTQSSGDIFINATGYLGYSDGANAKVLAFMLGSGLAYPAAITAGKCLEAGSTLGSIVVAASNAACGSSSGANTALSNLASVSINTALLAQTGVDLGSTTNPFRDLYVVGAGTFGTNYFKFTGTPTSTRTITVPDVTATMVAAATSTTATLALFATTTAGAPAYRAIATGDLPSIPPAGQTAAGRTFIKSFNIENPTTADSYLFMFEEGKAITLTRVACNVIGGTNLVINLRKTSEATSGSGGTAALTSNLTCTAGAFVSSTTFTSAGVATRTPVALEIVSASGTNTFVHVEAEFTVD